MASSGEAKEEDVMLIAEKNLASIKKTLDAIDRLENRWKEVQKEFGMKLSFALQITMGATLPTKLTDEEKQSVLGGKPTLNEICIGLKNNRFKKIIVMAGAGISVSAGIPDFRSPGSGLYDSIDLSKHNLPSPQAVFEIEHFHKDPRPFFSVIKQLLPGNFKPTTAHYFLKLLADKKLLYRCYTQNIDGLERLAGVPEDNLVEAHGTLARAQCTSCGKRYNIHEVQEAVMTTEIPTCSKCKSIIKPSIIFFGEELPARFRFLHTEDFEVCDLLIVMGTSLKVLPFSSLINRVKDTTPRLLASFTIIALNIDTIVCSLNGQLNRERVGSFTLEDEGGYRDVAVLQDCDRSVREICEHCGWTKDLEAFTRPAVAKSAQAIRSINRPAGPTKIATVPSGAKSQVAAVGLVKKKKHTPTKTADHRH